MVYKRPSQTAVGNVRSRYMGLDNVMGVEVGRAGLSSWSDGYGEACVDSDILLSAGTTAAYMSLLGSDGSYCLEGCRRHLYNHRDGLPVASSSSRTSDAPLDTLNSAASHLEMGNGGDETPHSRLPDAQHHRAKELVE
jgi:hypothetical protein